MTQPVSVQVFTIGTQGPPGVGVSFGAISLVTASATLASGTYSPVDVRAGSIVLTLPPAVDGSLVGVADVFGYSAINPIVVNAQGAGVLVADPSNPGAYAASVHIAQQGQVVWWAFVLGTAGSVNRWLPVWW